MTESNLILCDPRASSAGKSGTVSSTTPPLGKFVIVTFNGSSTTITLWTEESFIQDKDNIRLDLPTEERWHSELPAHMHPTYQDAKQFGTSSHRFEHRIDWWLPEENLGVSEPWACRDAGHPNLYEEYIRKSIIPAGCLLLDSACFDELGNLSFRNDCILKIESTIFPLDWAIDVKRIAQPVVRRTSREKYFLRWNPCYSPTIGQTNLAWNSFVHSEWVMFSMESFRQCV